MAFTYSITILRFPNSVQGCSTPSPLTPATQAPPPLPPSPLWLTHLFVGPCVCEPSCSSCTAWPRPFCSGTPPSTPSPPLPTPWLTYLFVGPRVREPPDDPRFQLLGYPPEAHVLLDPVHLVLELHPRHVHVADHATDVSDDGGENQHASQEVNDHKEVFDVVLWLWCLS